MRSPRGEQLVAVFEALKGLLVLLVGFGLLSVVNEDLAQLAEELVGHFHLNPASHYPRIFLEAALRISDLRLWALALFAFAYASLRLAEAYGLWRGRRWAEWLAVASGTLLVPIEIYELRGRRRQSGPGRRRLSERPLRSTGARKGSNAPRSCCSPG